MSTIKTILIDDEIAAINVLSNLIKLSFPNIEIVGTAENLPSGVDLINEVSPDLVFLDVEMPNYSGYEITNFFEEINFHIIFVTAYNKYALEALKINAVDYLLKPVDRNQLKIGIEKVALRIKNQDIISNYKSALKELNQEKTISFGESGRQHIIPIRSIIAVSGDGSYSQVLLENRNPITLSKNIGAIEEELSEYSNFFRCHRSWVINQNHIKEYQKGEKNIVMTNDTVAKLSRLKKDEFESLLSEK